MPKPLNQNSRRNKKPTKAEYFQGEVRDLASDGRGVVRHPDGRTYFVPEVWLGESGTFKVEEIKGRVGSASVEQLDVVSDHRIAPLCPYFGSGKNRCGGCAWQFIHYEAQLEAKMSRVRKAMTRIQTEDRVLPIIASPQQWRYRNRSQLKTDGEKLGYVSARTNALVDIQHCEVLTEDNALTLSELRKLLPNKLWTSGKKQRWTTLDIDENTSVELVSINQRLPFRQGNTQQNNRMREWLAEKLAPEKNGVALELFCGSGNFTEVISRSGFDHIIAAEISEHSISELNRLQYPNVEALVVDLYDDKAMSRLAFTAKQATVLVLDPPRDGLKIRQPFLTKKSQLKTIYYISCDLATFYRDVKDFMASGFSLEEVQPIDLFPQTPHVEIMGVMRR